MNIIIILKGVKKSSAGIVFERILNGLVKNEKVNVISIFSFYKSQSSNFEIVSANFSPNAGQFNYKLKLILLNQEEFQGKWAKFILDHLHKNGLNQKVDFILCLASGGAFAELFTVYTISRALKIPYHIHTIDAIPPPPWWGENKILNWAKRRYARKLFASASSFSAISRKMVEYQEYLSRRKARSINPVIPNPVSKIFVEKESYQSDGNKPIKLLYLGKLNKTRNGKALIDSLGILNQDDVNARLDIIGLSEEKFLSNLGLSTIPKNVNLEPWTEKPEKRIAQADVLVDIDINNKKDVFISGKLLTYLCSNIPILSITTDDSPSAELLSSQRYGVRVVNHFPKQIAESIMELSRIKDYIQISKERKLLIQKLSSKVISNALVENILNTAKSKS